MKIVIDCRFILHSGIGRYIREIVKRLTALRDHEYTLIGNRADYDADFFSRTASDGARVVWSGAAMYSASEQLILPFTVPECDVFWSPHYSAPALPVRARRRVVTIHDACHLAFSERLPLVKRLYARLFMYTAAHLYDRILTVSEFSKREILRFEDIPPEKIEVVYGAASPLTCADIDDAGTGSAARDGAGDFLVDGRLRRRDFFLAVGSAKPHKNIGCLLRAFRIFRERCPGMRLAIVGNERDFSGDATLRPLIESLGEDVVFCGTVGDGELLVLYQNSCALVFPSLYEGFGLPPLEAMAARCPVIASSSPPMPEVLGSAALYFDPLSPEDCAGEMERLVRSPALLTELIKKGEEHQKAFSWDDAARRIFTILTETGRS